MQPQLKVYSTPSTDQQALIDQAKRLTALFCRECGFKPLPYMAREFARYLVQGYEPDLLEEIINRTAMAPRPSFAYFRAVITRSGCHTLHDFLFHPHQGYSDFDRAFDQAFSSLDPDTEREILSFLGPSPATPSTGTK